MQVFKRYLEIYNQKRQANDLEGAKEYANLILQYANKEVQNPNVSDVFKSEFVQNAKIVKKFLDDLEKIKNAPAPATKQSASDDASKTDWFAADIPNLSMKDVAGLQEVKDALLVNVFAALSPKYAPIYRKYRKDIGLQILLYGPPGTGKTHLVKCLAGQLGCKIAVVQIKDVMANLVGDGAKVIHAIFEQAKKYDKCIIFFDEIDAIAASREDDESRHTKEQLTTLLTNMDGFTAGTKENQIRIIVAATNRPWILDSAVKRGGRFETQIYIPLPDMEARRKLISIYLGKDESIKDRLDIPCAPDVTIDWVAKKTEGYAGADIKAICKQVINRPLEREVKYFSAHGTTKDDCVTRDDVEEVLRKYINSITDEMLMSFDAYSKNMTLMEYLAHLKK